MAEKSKKVVPNGRIIRSFLYQKWWEEV